MGDDVVNFLENHLKQTNCFLEYGAGGSTVLAASLGVPRIVSVESNPEFARAVGQTVAAKRTKSTLHLITLNFGPTQDWGMPATYEAHLEWPSYALRPWEFLRENHLSPELILIDGRFRVACFFASLLDARPGTVILFDDYLLRETEYRVIENILAPKECIEKSAVFVVPSEIPLREVARALARYVTHPL